MARCIRAPPSGKVVSFETQRSVSGQVRINKIPWTMGMEDCLYDKDDSARSRTFSDRAGNMVGLGDVLHATPIIAQNKNVDLAYTVFGASLRSRMGRNCAYSLKYLE